MEVNSFRIGAAFIMPPSGAGLNTVMSAIQEG